MPRLPDRCPGVLRTHAAADGRLARIRLSGGRIDAAHLDALADAADDYGDGHLELTVRANIQIRGVAEEDVQRFADRVIASGLVPSPEHDRVRNLVVSPLTGRIGGRAALWPVADELERGLLAQAWTSELSGRFWFGLDDGRGDVLRRVPDVTGLAVDPAHGEVLIGGTRTGVVVPLTVLPAALLSVARHFLELRSDEWRIADLTAEHRDALRSDLVNTSHRLMPDPARHSRACHSPACHSGALPQSGGPLPTSPPPRAPLVGWLPQDDGRVALGAVTEFGRISSRQARFAAAIGAPLIITADREILILDLTEEIAETVVRVLAPQGFIFDANSPWTRVGACTGAPGCSNADIDVRGRLRAHLAAGGPVPEREHWVACERACGSPPDTRVRIVDQRSR